MSGEPLRILFLCTGNSCRSQMAEAWARSLGQGRVEAFSAGTDPRGVHPLTIEVMSEVGLDLSSQRSKHVDELKDQTFDAVITVCDRARESCPIWPGVQSIHWSFDDPAAATGSKEERLEVFRRVSREIERQVSSFLGLRPSG